MTPVKVLHLITDLATGGAQRALVQLVCGLDGSRFTPVVACLAPADTALAQELRGSDIPVFGLGYQSGFRPQAFFQLAALLRKERPTILHTWLFHANFLGRLAGRAAGVPIIVSSRRNTNIGGQGRERLNRLTAGLDDAVVAVCQAAAALEIERAGIPPEKVIVIYNGLNTHGFSAFPPGAHEQVRGELGIPLDAFAVGSVGRLHPQKGYDLLLQAVGFLHTRIPTLRVLIVGEGEARPALEQQRRELGLEEVVIFAGERRDIPAMLSALDGFVSASRWEGLSNAVLEAAAAGLPVIATRVGGTPEIVLDGETGLLVEPEDAQGLATAILQLYENPELRRRLGQAGQQRVEAAFTLRTTIQKTGQLYTRLLAKRRLGG